MQVKGTMVLLNSTEIASLKKFKYVSYKRIDKKEETKSIYKSLSNKTILLFSIQVNDNFMNLYMPTIFLDYIRFAFKDSILLHQDVIENSSIEKIVEEVEYIFKNQNRDYRRVDYDTLMEKYNLDFNSSYKDKAKSLYEYSKEKASICPFYFWFAVVQNIFPYVKYKGEVVNLTKNTIIKL